MIEEFVKSITQNEYLAALIYLVLSFAFIRLGALLLEKVILKITVRTKTNLDDEIIEKSKNPITLAVLLIGVKIALNQLTIPENIFGVLSKIIYTGLFLVAAYLAYKVFDLVFERGWKRFAKKTKTKANDALIQLTQGTIKVVIIIVVAIYLLSYWGIEIGPLLAGIGIGGVAIAFALQSSLANVFGGVSIILDKTIRVGDWIKIEDGTVGIIQKIGLRSTKLKTFDNETIFIPNSILSNTKVQNIALPSPQARVVIPFGAAYGSDIEKVKKVVLKELSKVKHYIDDPEPTVKFLEMGNSSLNFKAYFYVDTFENRFGAIDEANTRIYNALNKAGIEIPFPQMDVHFKNEK